MSAQTGEASSEATLHLSFELWMIELHIVVLENRAYMSSAFEKSTRPQLN